MTVRSQNGVIYLEGFCPVEDAETLVGALDAETLRVVDLSDCRQLHGAVVQVLLVFRPTLRGEPEEPFLRSHLAPAVLAGMGLAVALASASEDRK